MKVYELVSILTTLDQNCEVQIATAIDGVVATEVVMAVVESRLGKACVLQTPSFLEELDERMSRKVPDGPCKPTLRIVK